MTSYSGQNCETCTAVHYNGEKMEYMQVEKNPSNNLQQRIQINNFEQFKEFIYLGSLPNRTNTTSDYIKNR